MDILGIGFPELLFIFVIALMIFGPRRLPEMAAKAGRLVRDLRNISQGFMSEWQREITVATRLEELEQVRKELEVTKQSLQQVKHEVLADAAEIGHTVKTAVAIPGSIPPIPSPAESNEISSEKDVPPLPTAATPPVSPMSSVEATE